MSLGSLSFSYGACRALDRVGFDVPAGKIIGLLGANGAGKTTAIRLIAGLMHPEEGRIVLNGREVTGSPQAASHLLGVVLSENVLPEPTMGVRQYLLHFARIKNVDRPETRVRWLLSDLNLAEFENAEIRILSGGNRRKVEIARALLHDPPYLVLDEPSRELDIPTKEDLWSLLRERARSGTGILLSTHEAPEITAVCDGLVVLAKGRVRWQGETKKLGVERLDQALAALMRG